MTELLRNFTLIEKVCDELIQSKKCFYSVQQIWKDLKDYPNLKIETLQTQEQLNKLSFLLIRNTPTITKSQVKTCLIYLHGLSSYCGQGKFLIPYLGEYFNLCLFDSRGHGRSTIDNITYGLHESEDLNKILLRLKKEGMNEFVIWGRSMGAVTSLMLLINQHKFKQVQQNIQYVVLDSPFSSFKQVTADIVMKKMFLPEFIAKIISQSIISKVSEKYKYQLGTIDVKQSGQINTPAIFIYSDTDKVISPTHTHSIYENYTAVKQKIKIDCQHNQRRPQSVILNIIKKIRLYISKKSSILQTPIQVRRGINITHNLRTDKSITIPKNREILGQKINLTHFYNNTKINNKNYTNKINKTTNMPITTRFKQNQQILNEFNRKRIITPKHFNIKKLTNQFYL